MLSPLTQRRLANFRANKRGYWSLIIFGMLFFITLFAEFLANDRPILARIDGRWYAPVLVDYAESDIVEDGLPTLVDWHDRGFREEIDAKGGPHQRRLQRAIGLVRMIRHGMCWRG